MTIETTTAGVLALIAIMALVTLVTRFGGVFAMSFVRISPRIESFINTMASSVLIAIVVPMAFSGDAGAVAALSVTAVTMLALRKPLPAIGAGIAAAGSCATCSRRVCYRPAEAASDIGLGFRNASSPMPGSLIPRAMGFTPRDRPRMFSSKPSRTPARIPRYPPMDSW